MGPFRLPTTYYLLLAEGPLVTPYADCHPTGAEVYFLPSEPSNCLLQGQRIHSFSVAKRPVLTGICRVERGPFTLPLGKKSIWAWAQVLLIIATKTQGKGAGQNYAKISWVRENGSRVSSLVHRACPDPGRPETEPPSAHLSRGGISAGNDGGAGSKPLAAKISPPTTPQTTRQSPSNSCMSTLSGQDQ
ncbi:uncharacterized protein LY79DRAFT_248313 [Colletotrichum navitas]|uniref:Uncharacterized protein n=1 Tax=Colletotrichum navitas TaxID=681940 RepID=A0AAD8QCM3_9PEZI|nr:uncharacterized protein LY79DRAFT_248313 [Colletotrichum navitas]KAK1598574.1 hypothetical protein LY79DRAFT_248313 [Colletotrichum navitas]